MSTKEPTPSGDDIKAIATEAAAEIAPLALEFAPLIATLRKGVEVLQKQAQERRMIRLGGIWLDDDEKEKAWFYGVLLRAFAMGEVPTHTERLMLLQLAAGISVEEIDWVVAGARHTRACRPAMKACARSFETSRSAAILFGRSSLPAW